MMLTPPRHAIVVSLIMASALLLTSMARAAADRLNFLLITVDDMNCDSVGVYGSKVPGTTPNIDAFSKTAIRFKHAHVTIAVCQPTRAVWLTGRYPHRNGALGFQPITRGVPTLLEAVHDAGYLTGVMAKVPHMLPSRAAAWDVKVQANELRNGRDPALYYKHAKAFFEQAKSSGKPFFLAANSQDPHRPFAGSAQEGGRKGGADDETDSSGFPQVTNPFKPKDVVVPGFLPDIPDVRKEIAQYFTSVRRADETVGQLLRALRESGLDDSTLVMFVSDHGMALPFAKTNCYYHSTRTPWMIRWPGRTKADSIDMTHMISGIDLTPTALDILGVKPLEGMDGRSFKPLLVGEEQSGRDMVFTQFHRTAGRRDYPMRAVQDKRFGYIYNPWSDGKEIFRNESQAGLTMKAMAAAAKDDPAIAARVELFLKRVPEELYDYQKDPDALHNLINDAKYAAERDRLRAALLAQMKATDDPLAESFAKVVHP